MFLSLSFSVYSKMLGYLQAADVDAKQVFVHIAKEMSIEQLQKVLSVTAGTAGGGTDFKVQQAAISMGGTDLATIIDHFDGLAGVIESSKAVISYVYHASGHTLGTLRAVIEYELMQKQADVHAEARARANIATNDGMSGLD